MKIEVSNGELVDKFLILEIKMEKAKGVALEKKKYISQEYNMLKPLVRKLKIDKEILKNLKKTNLSLWSAEDGLRKKDKKKEFDGEFLNLAKSIYINNDARFKIKDLINQTTGSLVKEQKIY